MSWFVAALTRNSISIPHIFLETGSYLGDNIEHVLKSTEFKKVYSVEISERWYQHCTGRFSQNPNVEVILGDSATVLEHYELPQEPILFYLDAHFSGGETGGEYIDNGCPVLRELGAICKKRSDISGDVIVIDDMRLMGVECWSGTVGDKVYPRTFFNFKHASLDAMNAVLGNSGRTYKMIRCHDADRMIVTFS